MAANESRTPTTEGIELASNNADSLYFCPTCEDWTGHREQENGETDAWTPETEPTEQSE